MYHFLSFPLDIRSASANQARRATGAVAPAGPGRKFEQRRGYLFQLLRAGVDVFAIQRLAGQADAVTTARYDRRGEGERRRAAALLRIPS